jgi:DNA-binding LacI/PurR family transcriptional regulator
LTYLRPFTSVWSEARLRGARSAALDGLRVFPSSQTEVAAPSTVQKGQFRAGEGFGRELLAAGFDRGVGLIAPNDAVAMGVMAAASERGLTAGADYGLIGFDDWYRESHLSSLCPPLSQLGGEAAGLLLRLLRGEAAPARIALQHRLIARASSAGGRWESTT